MKILIRAYVPKSKRSNLNNINSILPIALAFPSTVIVGEIFLHVLSLLRVGRLFDRNDLDQFFDIYILQLGGRWAKLG